MAVRHLSPVSQKAVLAELAQLAYRSIDKPNIVEAARAITSGCASRDDMCELEAIFSAVKDGTDSVPCLRNGLRYVSDPKKIDFFTAPTKILELCTRGACAGDCDEHAALVAALCGAIGFTVGLRAWGESADEYTHVYAVVGFPKHNPQQAYGMDTTVDEAHVGWEPPNGSVLTAWIDEDVRAVGGLRRKRR